uniref:Uncharacterized protein n=1 Tax=Anopheles culicifacies TaxID=139723 RepID=A0A182MU15_9DIPT
MNGSNKRDKFEYIFSARSCNFSYLFIELDFTVTVIAAGYGPASQLFPSRRAGSQGTFTPTVSKGGSCCIFYPHLPDGCQTEVTIFIPLCPGRTLGPQHASIGLVLLRTPRCCNLVDLRSLVSTPNQQASQSVVLSV